MRPHLDVVYQVLTIFDKFKLWQAQRKLYKGCSKEFIMWEKSREFRGTQGYILVNTLKYDIYTISITFKLEDSDQTDVAWL